MVRASHIVLAAGAVCTLFGLALARLACGVLMEEAKANRLMALADRKPKVVVGDRREGERWDQGWGGW